MEASRSALTATAADLDGLVSLMPDRPTGTLEAVADDFGPGPVADLVRFLLAFALPAAGMTVYRWIVNRQRTQAEMRLRIEAEKAINKSKDEFIANVSHELRTPLTGIVGFAQLLESSELQQPTSKYCV